MRRASLASLLACATALAPARAADGDEPRTRSFGDPFVQATRALPACPVPEPPLYTEREAREQAHSRVERGTTCYRTGRCRLPNAYLYDREIVPRVVRLVGEDERFAEHSSVWVLGQRRWVYLKGCVDSAAAAEAMERAVRLVDDVEAVVVELMVGGDGAPPYRVAP